MQAARQALLEEAAAKGFLQYHSGRRRGLKGRYFDIVDAELFTVEGPDGGNPFYGLRFRVILAIRCSRLFCKRAKGVQVSNEHAKTCHFIKNSSARIICGTRQDSGFMNYSELRVQVSSVTSNKRKQKHHDTTCVNGNHCRKQHSVHICGDLHHF